jgi:hypothetical protein
MPQQGNERAGITLTGDELVLLEQVKRVWGVDADGKKRMSNSKLLGMCMEQTLHQRLNIMKAWVELMSGVQGTMDELGVEKEWCEAILWFNTVGQSVFTNQISPQEIRSDPTHPDYDPGPADRKAEEEMRAFFREVRGK